MRKVIQLFVKFLWKIDFKIQLTIKKFEQKLTKSKLLIKNSGNRSLYKTIYGDKFWLDKTKYIDNLIIINGIFEAESTGIIKKLVKKDGVVFDIGANIGYYSVVFSKLVGNNGKVFAFEPVEEYYEILKKNLKENSINNCEIIKLGLSNSEKNIPVYLNDSSATIHSLDKKNEESIIIKLTTLNKFIEENNIRKIDFIKIDVDGHELAVLEGGWKVIEKYKPIIILELSHLHYLEYGVNAWDFYEILRRKGFYIYTEVDFREIKNKQDFLMSCSNFNHTTNIIISLSEIKI